MSKVRVLAKFRIVGLESQRNVERPYNAETREYGPVTAGESCNVRLQAVQGEPFGKYTPNGQVQMTINNPAAAAVFREAWERFVKADDPEAKAPEFFVTFKEDDGTGSE